MTKQLSSIHSGFWAIIWVWLLKGQETRDSEWVGKEGGWEKAEIRGMAKWEETAKKKGNMGKCIENVGQV